MADAFKEDAPQNMEGKILHAGTGYNCTRNEFAYVVKETAKTLKVTLLKRRITAGDFMDGTEVPIPPTQEELQKLDKKDIFPLQKQEVVAGKTPHYWGRSLLFSLWDGQPKAFNSD